MKTKDFLKQHSACTSGAKWALSISEDMADVWDAMIEHGKLDWLIWTATRPGVFPDSVLRKLACRFVRETPWADGRKVWDLLTDERSRNAVEVSEAYADGNATYEELDAARDAAYYTAYEARAAARDAAVAAYAAAARDAARDAAVAAYAAAARDATRAAARAALDALDAARAAAYDAYAALDAAAKAAQVQMIAELGNPFK
jgi:hypothetical protein